MNSSAGEPRWSLVLPQSTPMRMSSGWSTEHEPGFATVCPSINRRRVHVGRPGFLPAGSNGFSRAHWSLVRSSLITPHIA